MSRFLLNIEKRSLPGLMLGGVQTHYNLDAGGERGGFLPYKRR
jgi:hypothetical protein